MHRPPDIHTTTNKPLGSLVRLSSARVFSHHGVIIDSSNHLLRDLSPDLRPPTSGHRLLSLPQLPDPTPLQGTLFSLATPSSQKSYFHWLLDAVPRLRHIDQKDYDHFFTPLRHPYHTEVLNRLTIPTSRWLEARETSHYLCPHLHTVSPLPLGTISRDDLEFLRALFAPSSSSPSRRLYLSRADSWRRRITNEDALLTILKPLGFETITCRGLSIVAQAKLFSQAEVILAPHGAALTNLIFAPPTCRVIELMASNYQYPYYRELAALCGLPYQCHLSPTAPGDPEHPLALDSLKMNILASF